MTFTCHLVVTKKGIITGKNRTVKMGWKSQANSAHHWFGPGWVEFFLQISVRVNFWPGSPGLNSWWVRLIYQPANNGSHKYFLLYWILHLTRVKFFFFSQHIGNMYFCDFGLYLELNILLDCIWILLKFIYILIIIII